MRKGKLLVFAMVLGMTACAQNGGAGTMLPSGSVIGTQESTSDTTHAQTLPIGTELPLPDAGAVTITVWAEETDTAAGGWLDTMLPRFEAQYPQYDIVWNVVAHASGADVISLVDNTDSPPMCISFRRNDCEN